MVLQLSAASATVTDETARLILHLKIHKFPRLSPRVARYELDPRMGYLRVCGEKGFQTIRPSPLNADGPDYPRVMGRTRESLREPELQKQVV